MTQGRENVFHAEADDAELVDGGEDLGRRRSSVNVSASAIQRTVFARSAAAYRQPVQRLHANPGPAQKAPVASHNRRRGHDRLHRETAGEPDDTRARLQTALEHGDARFASAGGDRGSPGQNRHRFLTTEGGMPHGHAYPRGRAELARPRTVDQDGDKIGSIDEIYLDRDTEDPEWAVVTTGLFGTKRTFVPLSEAQPLQRRHPRPVEKATVKDAPRIDPDGELSRDEDQSLYRPLRPRVPRLRRRLRRLGRRRHRTRDHRHRRVAATAAARIAMPAGRTPTMR